MKTDNIIVGEKKKIEIPPDMDACIRIYTKSGGNRVFVVSQSYAYKVISSILDAGWLSYPEWLESKRKK